MLPISKGSKSPSRRSRFIFGGVLPDQNLFAEVRR
jgi:hypothetical protein